MEGLLIAEELRKLAPLLPALRLSWRFPDPWTFVLPLREGALWLYVKPPAPRLAYLRDVPPADVAKSGFQELLAARASGELLSAMQHKLDRVVELGFAAGEGFVATPPCTLVAELTGRNCNLVLMDAKGTILGVAREIDAGVNRYRQLRAGLPYLAPPPYDKLDPRRAGEAELRERLAGRPLRDLHKIVDGVGPDLTRAIAKNAGVAASEPLGSSDLDAVLAVLERAAAEPGRLLAETLQRPDLAALRRDEGRAAMLQRVRHALLKQSGNLEKRLQDIDRARRAAGEAEDLRRRAEVLLAYAHDVPPEAHEAMLTDFDGEPLRIALDPRLGAVANAQALYRRAKNREARAAQAAEREPALRWELREAQELLAELDGLPAAELQSLAQRYAPKRAQTPRSQPGIRYMSPQGYQVLVGRNSKENDTITFRLARSKDVWLHAQGYPGSHVLVQAENREVPPETILFAARLAAAYSKASSSDNVPVDYTLRKNVWKPKGGAPGAALFSQQKTLYVSPSRRPGEA